MELLSKLTFTVVSFGLVISCNGIAVADCDYNDNNYPDQSEICRSGHKYKCEYKTWIDLSEVCENSKPTSACTCVENEIEDLTSCMCKGNGVH